MARSGEFLATGSGPVPIGHPQPGWAQQHPGKMRAAAVAAISACRAAGPEAEVAAIGISSPSESILVSDRATGAPLGPAATGQCHRSTAAGET